MAQYDSVFETRSILDEKLNCFFEVAVFRDNVLLRQLLTFYHFLDRQEIVHEILRFDVIAAEGVLQQKFIELRSRIINRRDWLRFLQKVQILTQRVVLVDG